MDASQDHGRRRVFGKQDGAGDVGVLGTQSELGVKYREETQDLGPETENKKKTQVEDNVKSNF